MKAKTKIIIFSLFVCVIVAFGTFCVFALQNFSLNVAGKIKFVAPSVNATISQATLSGLSKETGSGTMSGFSISSAMTTEQVEALPEYQSWSGLKLLFDDDSEGIGAISFTVTNNSTKDAENIMVNISTNTTASSPIQAAPCAGFCIEPGNSHTFTVNLVVASQEKSVEINDCQLTVELGVLKSSEIATASELIAIGFDFEKTIDSGTSVISRSRRLVFVPVPSAPLSLTRASFFRSSTSAPSRSTLPL